MKNIAILGTRGVPAAHGGFETFAEELSKYLAQRGWHVTVYCQHLGAGSSWTDHWEGVERIHVPVKAPGARGTIIFDWRAVGHALTRQGIKLVLGYNTAIFNLRLIASGHAVITNMDGIEWRRQKWGAFAKAWFFLNELAGSRFSSHLVADHPEIKRHLSRHTKRDKIAMIPYGAHDASGASLNCLATQGLEPGNYGLVIARPEPENSVLQIVRAFSAFDPAYPLVVLGDLDPKGNAYHRAVCSAASPATRFPGAIFDKAILRALRAHCAVYVHGHTVGGTNPSLVEALGAASPIVAHDNRFNRWVAGPAAKYFSDVSELCEILSEVIGGAEVRRNMSSLAHERFLQCFTWPAVLGEYERLFESCIKVGAG